MNKEKILVSACLIGRNVRYDGTSKTQAYLMELEQQGRVIPICPEVMGGLPIPRVPSEQKGEAVYSKTGVDVTKEFTSGAQQALELARQYDIHIAILKSKSPSCGKGIVYDGTFTGKLTEGNGVTVKLLKEAGLEVMDEYEGEKWYEQHQ